MRVCLVTIEADHWRVERPDGGLPPVSGMGEMVRLTARVLHEAGHQVLAAQPPTPSLRAALEPYCSTFVDIHPSTKRAMFGRNVRPILRILRQHRPDIIHFHVPNYRWALDSLAASNVARTTKVVRTEHNPMMNEPEQPYRALLHVADRAVDRFVYCSVGNRRRFEELMPWRPPGSVVVNVVDPDRVSTTTSSAPVEGALATRQSLPPDARVAVFVAGSWHIRSSEGRRPLGPVLEAMASIPSDWHLFVAGTGDIAAASACAAELGIDERVHLLGPAPDVARLIATCDVLVSASHFEGLSVAYLEAWYAGVPVLCTLVDGIEDVVGDDVGVITAPHGDTAAFAERWRQVGDPSSEFMRVSDAAVTCVRESFLVDRYSREMLAVYDELLDEGRGAPH